jgi:hypothetical protein
MPVIPRCLDRPLVREMIADIRSIRPIGLRVETISRRFLGVPYLDNPLGGSMLSHESLTASLDAFDCVTYVESILALALASRPEDFPDNLRCIRYRDGNVDWRARNHYMTTWIRNNVRSGFVRNLTQGVGLVERSRKLNIVEGLTGKTVRVRSIRKRDFLRRVSGASSGDLVFFASTRRNLDVFHCGILIRSGERTLLRHAARSRGRVLDQDFDGFLTANRMSGVILVRPRDVGQQRFPRQ